LLSPLRAKIALHLWVSTTQTWISPIQIQNPSERALLALDDRPSWPPACLLASLSACCLLWRHLLWCCLLRCCLLRGKRLPFLSF
jgi:hypothetical protein